MSNENLIESELPNPDLADTLDLDQDELTRTPDTDAVLAAREALLEGTMAEEEPATVPVTQQPVDAALLRKIIEGAILAAAQPMTVARMLELFDTEVAPTKDEILAALAAIQADNDARGFELKEVASGWRFQVREELAPWVNRLWDEKPQKYSRALLETLALIAYRQPITRGDIEEIRGVAVSSHIIKTLLERDWVKVVGHRDVPGRPSLYATTRQFLDYFNLKSLEQLPSLSEIRDLDELNPVLNLGEVEGLGEKDTDTPIPDETTVLAVADLAAETRVAEPHSDDENDAFEPVVDAVDEQPHDSDNPKLEVAQNTAQADLNEENSST